MKKPSKMRSHSSRLLEWSFSFYEKIFIEFVYKYIIISNWTFLFTWHIIKTQRGSQIPIMQIPSKTRTFQGRLLERFFSLYTEVFNCKKSNKNGRVKKPRPDSVLKNVLYFLQNHFFHRGDTIQIHCQWPAF